MQPQLSVKKSLTGCPPEFLFGGSNVKDINGKYLYKEVGPNKIPWQGNNLMLWVRRSVKPIKELVSLESEQIRDVDAEPTNIDALVLSFEAKSWDYQEPPLTYFRDKKAKIDVLKSGENRKKAQVDIGWLSTIADEVEFKDRVAKRIAAVQCNNTNPSVPNNIETMAKNLHAALRDHDLGMQPTEDQQREYVRVLYGSGDKPNMNIPKARITKILNRAENFGVHGVLNRKFNKAAMAAYCKEWKIPAEGSLSTTGRYSWVVNDMAMRFFLNQLMKAVIVTAQNLTLSTSEKGKNIKIGIRGYIDKPDQNIIKMKKKREQWFDLFDKEILSVIRDFYNELSLGGECPTFDILFYGFIAQNGGADANQKVLEPLGTDVFEDWMIPLCKKYNLKYGI